MPSLSGRAGSASGHTLTISDTTGTVIVNAVTLVFGRFGYERLVWVGESTHDSAAFLTDMRQGFQFDPGARYADFRPGDKAATYGVAALVASLVGAKVAAKIGLLAIMIGLVKKLAIVIVAAGAGLFGFVKRVLTGRASTEGTRT